MRDRAANTNSGGWDQHAIWQKTHQNATWQRFLKVLAHLGSYPIPHCGNGPKLRNQLRILMIEKYGRVITVVGPNWTLKQPTRRRFLATAHQ